MPKGQVNRSVAAPAKQPVGPARTPVETMRAALEVMANAGGDARIQLDKIEQGTKSASTKLRKAMQTIKEQAQVIREQALLVR